MQFHRTYLSIFLATVIFADYGRSADFSVPELVAGYSEAASSIKTLYVEYRETYSDSEGQESSQNCVFARDGEKWHFSTRPIVGHGKPVEETVTCSDGKQAFLYYLRRGSANEVDFGTIEITESREEPMVSPEYAIGLKVPELARHSGAKGSLLFLLNSGPPITVESETSVGSGGLSVFPVSVEAGTVQVDYRISVNIDSDHGFLPAMYKVEFSDETKKKYPSHRDWSLRWETTEFRRFPDRLRGGERWFPSAAKFTQGRGQSDDGKSSGSTYGLSIRLVTINENLDPSLFNPQIPPGTTVVDSTSTGKGRVSLYGGAQAVDIRARQLAEISDRSRGGQYRSILIGVNLLVIISAAIYFFFVRKRSGT